MLKLFALNMSVGTQKRDLGCIAEVRIKESEKRDNTITFYYVLEALALFSVHSKNDLVKIT